MKTARFFLFTCCAALAGVTSTSSAASAPGNPVTSDSTTNLTASHNSATPALSPGLSEVVKLHKAGINDSVIRTFVETSQVAYRLSAQDIIRLRELGISPDIITALMKRGGEVRQAMNTAAQQAQAAASSAYYQAATSPGATAAYSSQGAETSGTSSLVYIGYPDYTYYSPWWYSYWWYYPGFYSYFPYYCYSYYPGLCATPYYGGHRYGGYDRGYRGGYRGVPPRSYYRPGSVHNPGLGRMPGRPPGSIRVGTPRGTRAGSPGTIRVGSPGTVRVGSPGGFGGGSRTAFSGGIRTGFSGGIRTGFSGGTRTGFSGGARAGFSAAGRGGFSGGMGRHR